MRMLLLFAFAFLGTSGLAQEQSSPTLRVGAILPLTADYAYVGEAFQQGMELALQELPKKSLQIVYEDEGVIDRTKAVSAFHKLVDVDEVHIVLGSVVNTATSYAPLAQRKKIPVMILWDSNRSIDQLGEYVYGLGYSTEQAAEDMASFARTKLRTSNVGIISAHDEWSEVIAESFAHSFRRYGGVVEFHERVKVDDTDLKSLLVRAKNLQLDAIYGPLYSRSLHSFIRQAREIGFSGHILSADGFLEQDLTAIGPGAEGIYFTQIWLENQELIRKHRARYKPQESRVNLGFIAMGYDVLMLLARVQQRLHSLQQDSKPDSIREALKNVAYHGISGQFDLSASRISNRRERLLVIEKGKFALAE